MFRGTVRAYVEEATMKLSTKRRARHWVLLALDRALAARKPRNGKPRRKGAYGGARLAWYTTRPSPTLIATARP